MAIQRYEVAGHFEDLDTEDRIYAELFMPPIIPYEPNLLFRIGREYFQMMTFDMDESRGELLDEISLCPSTGEDIVFNFKNLDEAQSIPAHSLFDKLALLPKVFGNVEDFTAFNTLVLYLHDFTNVPLPEIGRTLLYILLNPGNTRGFGYQFIEILESDRSVAIELAIRKLLSTGNKKSKQN